MKLRWFAAAAVIAAPATGAYAQAAAPQSQAPAAQRAAPAAKPAQDSPAQGNQVSGVTVTAQSNETRTSIDRRSYNIAGDLQTTTGSIGDALRNVPSVQVDLEGNLTLRGDGNVTIMIDGKPSGMFRGESRATALQQLPADQFERVEVMTNPSAAIRPDGAAGVINLITKKGRGGGQAGSVRVAAGNEGRYNAGGTLSYNSKKLGFSADVGVRHDERPVTFETQSTRLYNGQYFDSRNALQMRNQQQFYTGRVSLDYDLDDRNRLSGELRAFSGVGSNPGVGTASGLDSEGQLFNSAVTTANNRFRFSNGEISGSYRRKFSGDEHLFTLDLSQERSAQKTLSDSGVQATPALPDPYYQSYRTQVIDKTEAKAEYKRPVGDDDRLVTGYNLEITSTDADTYSFRGPTPLPRTPQTRYTYRFVVDQTVQGVYGTYEHKMGDFSVLAGLRVEQTELEANQLTARVSADNDYLKAYPSLHLQYRVSDAQQVTASYSRRIQRPQASDLNPARQYQDPFNYREGNPYLKPQETDVYELVWQYRKGFNFLLNTLYWNDSRNGVTDVTRDIGGGVLLTRRENLTSSRRGGLESVLSGRLTPKIRYNASTNVYWAEVEGTTFGYTQTQSGWSYQLNGSINWQVTPKDQIQLFGQARGKQFTPQGYQVPTAFMFASYSHTINKHWTVVANVQDVFESMRQETVIDTPVLRSRTKVNYASRAFYISLRYSFGAANNPRRQQQQQPAEDMAPPGGMGPF